MAPGIGNQGTAGKSLPKPRGLRFIARGGYRRLDMNTRPADSNPMPTRWFDGEVILGSFQTAAVSRNGAVEPHQEPFSPEDDLDVFVDEGILECGDGDWPELGELLFGEFSDLR